MAVVMGWQPAMDVRHVGQLEQQSQKGVLVLKVVLSELYDYKVFPSKKEKHF
jgi:hypothetical protein